MKKEELVELINSWENLPLMINELANSPENFDQLMEIALYSPDPKSWRAAYLFQSKITGSPSILQIKSMTISRNLFILTWKK